MLAALPPRFPKRGRLRHGHDSWLDGIDTDGLAFHDRGGYLSWHHHGLQVLQVNETSRGMRLRAGVQYTNPPSGREVFDKTFATTPTAAEIAVVNAKIRLAIEDGGSLSSEMREHKMQATLIDHPSALGLTQLWREYPAWRGCTTPTPDTRGSANRRTSRTAARPGFIDFLGIDARGVLHVVETKIGHDPKVVLQALDYAIWVKANDAMIRNQLRQQAQRGSGQQLDKSAGTNTTDIPDPPRDQSSNAAAPIHLVLGAPDTNDINGNGKGKGPAFNGYLAGQIEALAGDCKVHIYVTDEPTADPPSLTSISTQQMWIKDHLIAKPVTGPRWPTDLTTKLTDGDR